METFVNRAGFLAAIVACAVPASIGSTASAQDALGSGNALGRDTRQQDARHSPRSNALDANTRVGSGGENLAGAKVDYFSRNLIVTGDVGGGRGFRGSVGYKEQSEFSASTGADDNRQWRAYSVYSSPYMARANYNPLQASQEFGAIMYSRTYSNASARDILTNQQPLDARIAFDRFTADASKMKRQADIIDPANSNAFDGRIDWRMNEKQRTSSSREETLRGIPVDDLVGSLGLSSYDRQRLKQDILNGRTQREWIGDPLADNSLLPGASLMDDARVRTQIAPEYSLIVDTLKQRAGDKIPPSMADRPKEERQKELDKKLGGDMDWLRGQLMHSGVESTDRNGRGAQSGAITGTQGKSGDAASAGTAPRDEKTVRDEKAAQDALREENIRNGRAPDAPRAPEKSDGPSVDDLAYILRHGKSMQSLVPEDLGAIHDMMELGAVSMRNGEFFRAEERFSSVLQVLPANPLALAGVANAQLGAGLYVSSALSLRKLFATHPEMIGTRLGPEVLPTPARLEDALTAARGRLDAANQPSASQETRSDRFDFGLLVAYIGFQTDRPEVVREGLDGMRRTLSDDALVNLLQRIWAPDAAPDPTRPASPSVR